MAANRNHASDTARLRARIDRGETGTKVPAPDPAAAPLGTDDEAAGTAPELGAADAGLDRAARAAAVHPPIAADSEPLRRRADLSGPPAWWIWVGLGGVACVVVLAAVAMLV